MPIVTARPTRAALLGVLLLAGCGGSSSPPPPPPPAPTPITASGNAYEVITPAAYSAGGFDLTVPALAADERLALLVTNAGTADTTITLTAAGTSGVVGRLDAPLAAARLAAGADGQGAGAADPWLELHERTRRGHELARRRAETFLAQAAAAGGTPLSAPQPAVRVARAAAVNDQRSFYVYSYTTLTTTLQPAHLQYLSSDGAGGSHAQFWVTDAVMPSLQANVLTVRPDFFAALGNAYEQKVLPALGTYFGPESDVDGNGQVIFLFADLGKDAASGDFPVGYFYPADVYCLSAGNPACAGAVSNRADMLYLLDPVSFATNWKAPPGDPAFASTLDGIVDAEIPSTMAHELQHDVNFNARCLKSPGTCFSAPSPCPADPYRQAEQTWINEGLSMVSEDVAGFGVHTTSERSRLRMYLGCSVAGGAAPVGCTGSSNVVYYGYQNWSLTCWEADAIGNYGGAHAYMRYWLDQQGAGFTKALLNPAAWGKANVAQATGTTFDAGFAQFAAASLVSNEDTAAYATIGGYAGTISSAGNVLSEQRFNYGAFLPGGGLDPVQPPWAPWHHYTGSCGATPRDRTAYVNYTAFDPATPVGTTLIRRDGWGAFVTRGTGADATIQFRSAAASRPSVALVRYRGALPDALFTGCP